MNTATDSSVDSFRASLSIQRRVVHALVLREILTRYGRHGLGFLWLFLEPMLFSSGVLAVWEIFHAGHSAFALAPFALSGYASVLVWRYTIGRVNGAVEPNRSLLHHRNVRVIDLFVARLVLEVAATTTSFVVLYLSLMFLDVAPWPADVMKMMVGWGLLALLSASVALVIGTLATLNELAERIWHVFSYLFMGASGAFYVVSALPPRLQAVALWIPTVHCSELLREGIFGASYHGRYDISFVLGFVLLMLAPGLAMVRYVQSRVEGE